jgi:hypothetical protein
MVLQDSKQISYSDIFLRRYPQTSTGEPSWCYTIDLYPLSLRPLSEVNMFLAWRLHLD